jgi:hypothetical protein
MSGRSLALSAAGVWLAVACGGTVEHVPGDPSGGQSSSGGYAGSVGHGGNAGHGGGRAGASGSAGASAGAPADAGFDEYVDPGCPDAGLPPPSYDCDPFAAVSGCPDGEGCYPYVTQPGGTGCGVQSFGTVCALQGGGRQGDICDNGASDCVSGFVCVVGARPGQRCVQLCKLDGSASCPAGLICGELDVEGFGVCS